MQVNLDLQCRTTRNLSLNKVAEPTPNPVPEQQGEDAKSVYFCGKDKGGIKHNAMAVLLPLSLLSAGVTMSCSNEDDGYSESYAYSKSESNAEASTRDTTYGKGKDTVFVDRWHTVYVDTGSYHVVHDTIEKWKDNYQRPIPLDTLAKHMTIWGVEGADTTDNRNIVHYEYTRPWEYNTRVVANMDQLQSAYNKKTLVHNIEIFDYKGNHLSYGKHVRRSVDSPVTIQNYNGETRKTKDGIFLEIRSNYGDRKDADILDTKLESRYFLQTAGDSVRIYKQNEDGIFEENGRFAKGYLGDDTILLKDFIGRYPTEDHLTDLKIVAINDELLKNMYVRARDDEEAAAAK